MQPPSRTWMRSGKRWPADSTCLRLQGVHSAEAGRSEALEGRTRRQAHDHREPPPEDTYAVDVQDPDSEPPAASERPPPTRPVVPRPQHRPPPPTKMTATSFSTRQASQRCNCRARKHLPRRLPQGRATIGTMAAPVDALRLPGRGCPPRTAPGHGKSTVSTHRLAVRGRACSGSRSPR